MHLSWSHKLFLKINNKVGKYPILDSFMRFCARWLIFFLFLLAILWIFFFLQNYLYYLIIFAATIFTSYMVSIFIGLLAQHPRPEVEMPKIKHLIKPIGLWKSFPSDHTNFSFLVVFLLIIFGAPAIVWLVMLFFAVLIALARVYVGVHYPRDILGGFVLALILALGLYILIFKLLV